ncbi:MAG: hypothetical protein Q9210_006259 [Variospora velana]
MKIFLPLFFLTNTTSAWVITAFMTEPNNCYVAHPSTNKYLVHKGVGEGDCIELGVGGNNNDCFNSAWEYTDPCDPIPPDTLPKELWIPSGSYCKIFFHPEHGQGGVRDSAPACAPGAEATEILGNSTCIIGDERWKPKDDKDVKYMYLQCWDGEF